MELPRADRGVGGKTRWIAADGHSYHTQKEAIVAQLGLPPEPPEPPRRSSAGSAHWYMDGDVFDTRREAFHAYYKSKTSYVAKLGESLNSFDYPYDDYKETVLSEMTGRGRGESALALRLRGNDMQAAVKWLFDNPDHSHSRTEDMLGYGALSAFILHLYLMITYLGSLASDPCWSQGDGTIATARAQWIFRLVPRPVRPFLHGPDVGNCQKAALYCAAIWIDGFRDISRGLGDIFFHGQAHGPPRVQRRLGRHRPGCNRICFRVRGADLVVGRLRAIGQWCFAGIQSIL